MCSNFMYATWQILFKKHLCNGKSILGVTFGCIILSDIHGMGMREKGKKMGLKNDKKSSCALYAHLMIVSAHSLLSERLWKIPSSVDEWLT